MKLLITLFALLVLVAQPAYADLKLRRSGFESPEQFNQWYASKAGIMLSLAFNSGNVTDYDGNSVCSDYAFILSDLAARDGYRMDAVPVVNGYIANGLYVTSIMNYHCGNLIVIGNSWYYLEPNPYWNQYAPRLVPQIRIREGHW